MKIYIYDRKQILQVYYALSFPKNIVFDLIRLLLRLLLFDYSLETWCFQEKTKVSCYKSEINKSVMLHAF